MPSNGDVVRIAVIGASSTDVADGIRDYSHRLVASLQSRADVDAKMFCRAHGAFGTTFDASEAGWDGASADAIVVQYNPFWYGRRGFAPGLPVGLFRLRRSRPRTTIGLMVHENYIDPKNWKWALMGAWQRLQLRALQRIADVQLCSIEAWTDDLRRSAPDVPAYHLPVGSNLPDRRCARAASRARLALGPDDLALCAFGMRDAGRLCDRMLDAARAVRATGRRVVLLNLGPGEPATEELDSGVTLISPGFLPADAAAEAMAATDIFMAALEDGASTRRTTIMAALQHQVAVVGTNGNLTDKLLLDASQALRLVPVSEPERFVAAVVEVAERRTVREELARNGRTLYEERFDWPVLTDRLLGALGLTR